MPGEFAREVKARVDIDRMHLPPGLVTHDKNVIGLASRRRGAGAGGRFLQNLRRFFFAGGTIAVLVVVQSLRLASAEPVALSEPANVGDAKFAAVAYYKSGAYERDLAAVLDITREKYSGHSASTELAVDIVAILQSGLETF